MTLSFHRPLILFAILTVCWVFQSAPTHAGADTTLAVAQEDSVPSNLWLTRSLMEDLVKECKGALAPAPQNILLRAGAQDPETELFQAALYRVLVGSGYHVFLATADADTNPGIDVDWHFRVAGVKLAYPQVGRTLGIWRSWIARELAVTVFCTLSEVPSGRILFDDQLQLQFNDRFRVAELPRVESPLYDFTTAEPVNGSWHNRLEEIVVLGTLAGLVSVYFANTSN